jgi:hypothetical protein
MDIELYFIHILLNDIYHIKEITKKLLSKKININEYKNDLITIFKDQNKFYKHLYQNSTLEKLLNIEDDDIFYIETKSMHSKYVNLCNCSLVVNSDNKKIYTHKNCIVHYCLHSYNTIRNDVFNNIDKIEETPDNLNEHLFEYELVSNIEHKLFYTYHNRIIKIILYMLFLKTNKIKINRYCKKTIDYYVKIFNYFDYVITINEYMIIYNNTKIFQKMYSFFSSKYTKRTF